MMKYQNEDEKEHAEVQRIIAQQIAKWFHLTLRELETYRQCIDLVSTIFVEDKVHNDMLALIEIEKNKHSEPTVKFLKLFDYEARKQWKLFRKIKLNLTQTGLATPVDVLIDKRQRKGMKDDYFLLGVSPDGCGLVTGAKGSGKSSFVANEIVGPATEIENIQIVHNMNMVDPIENKMEALVDEYGKLFNYFPFYKEDEPTFLLASDSLSGYEKVDLIELNKRSYKKNLAPELIVLLNYWNDKNYNKAPFMLSDVGFNYWEFRHDDKNAVLLKNCYYASSIDDALIQIVRHALKGIQETGDPYMSIWIVDEAGISRGKQRSMENRLQFHKYLTLISRKLGCFELSIYQLDDAPKELHAFATIRYHKPSRKDKSLVESNIDSANFTESCTISGIMDWRDRKKYNEPYVEFNTYDIATMSSTFNLMELFDVINKVSKDGKPVKNEVQLLQILDFLETRESRISAVLHRHQVLIFILRNREHYKLVYQNLKDQKKLKEQDKLDMKQAKQLKTDDTAVAIARSELPDEDWYITKLRNEFKTIMRLYPDCLQWETIPTDDTLKDISGAVQYDVDTKQMYPIVCTDCGTHSQVPFEPKHDSPVYCYECYSKRKQQPRRF